MNTHFMYYLLVFVLLFHPLGLPLHITFPLLTEKLEIENVLQQFSENGDWLV